MSIALIQVFIREKGNDSVPTCFQVLVEIGGYKAATFLHLIHNVGLIHHVPLTERNKFFKMIRKQFPANVKSESRTIREQPRLSLTEGLTYLFTAFQMMTPSIIGTT